VPDARLVVAGDQSNRPNPCGSSRRSWAQTDRRRLRFIPGGEIPELFEEAAAVVLPYRHIESSGVLATALGHGRPVVVTDVGSLGDTVREYGAGVVAEPDDPASIAAACVSLLRDGELRDRAVRGTQAARDALSWERAAEAHEAVYAEVRAARGLR
jgi:glycosyltransferase involved in cell wall biosynthesis